MRNEPNEEPLMLPSDKRRFADLETRVDRQRNVGLVVLILLTVANIIGLVGNGVILTTMFDSADEIKKISEHNRALNEENNRNSEKSAVLVSELVEVINDTNRVAREHAGLPPGPQITTPISVPTTTTTTTTTVQQQDQSRRSTTPSPRSTTVSSSSTAAPPSSPPRPGPTPSTSPIAPLCDSVSIPEFC